MHFFYVNFLAPIDKKHFGLQSNISCASFPGKECKKVTHINFSGGSRGKRDVQNGPHKKHGLKVVPYRRSTELVFPNLPDSGFAELIFTLAGSSSSIPALIQAMSPMHANEVSCVSLFGRSSGLWI